MVPREAHLSAHLKCYTQTSLAHSSLYIGYHPKWADLNLRKSVPAVGIQTKYKLRPSLAVHQ